MVKEKDKVMYMDIAERVAQRSYAKRLQVGCVIEKNGSIISFGWNGMPSGYDNCCEHVDENGHEVTNREVQHAELNAIGKASKAGISTEGATLYITHSPCMNCSLIISVSGIKAVYYKETYRDDYGIQFLRDNGIYVEQVKMPEKQKHFTLPEVFESSYIARIDAIRELQKNTYDNSNLMSDKINSAFVELGSFLASVLKYK